MWLFSLSSNVTEKKWDFGGIGHLQASIRCYKRGNMWSMQRFLKQSRNSSLARLGKEAILPLSMLWISKSTHCTEIQPWCNQHEVSSHKCFPGLQRRLWAPVAEGLVPSLQPATLRWRPKLDALRWGPGGWAVPTEGSPGDGSCGGGGDPDSSTLTAEVTGFSSYQTEFLLGSPRALRRVFRHHRHSQTRKKAYKLGIEDWPLPGPVFFHAPSHQQGLHS